MTDKKAYGRLLVALRDRDRLSQRELAELLRVSAPAVCKWEKGDTLPSRELRVRIAELFHVSVKEMEHPEVLLQKLETEEIGYDQCVVPEQKVVNQPGAELTSGVSEVDTVEKLQPPEAAEENLAEIAIGNLTEISDDELPKAEQIKIEIMPQRSRKHRRILVMAGVLVLVCGLSVGLYAGYESRKAQKEPQIVRSFERYVEDPSWGHIYEVVYIMDKMPDMESEWRYDIEDVALIQLTEADLGVDVVRFAYYLDERDVTNNDVSDNGKYAYYFINEITRN
ncbi:MAG: helix-turn-helix domain-containing protein, partial [Lachnospiraceae bacterium]|nr:helix-turn-helix domain-containing protein [Lachnospiraceae bacterium]